MTLSVLAKHQANYPGRGKQNGEGETGLWLVAGNTRPHLQTPIKDLRTLYPFPGHQTYHLRVDQDRKKLSR